MKIALSKGRLSEESIKLFKQIGMAKSVDLKSRKLVFEDLDHNITYLLLKPKDVVTYVEAGIVDLGIVGSDVIIESEENVIDLCDLGFGKCKFSIATRSDNKDVLDYDSLKVATKYPKITKNYFDKIKKNIEIIPLSGSVELAPVMGFAHCIVDLVETGKTLEANDLSCIRDILDVSARLISNPIQYRFMEKEVLNLMKRLKEVI